ILVEDVVAQRPGAVVVHPQMRRAKAVAEMHEVFAIHDRRLELSARVRKLAARQAQIVKDLVGKTFWKFAVEAANERPPPPARDIARADFLRRIVGCPADAEFYESRVVVKVIDTVVD